MNSRMSWRNNSSDFTDIAICMNEIIGYVYMITNNVNGKRYVGITKRSIETRFKEHIKCSRKLHSKQIINHAIAKYGIENFSIEKLEECKSLTRMRDAEMSWIEKMQSHVSFNGYNVSMCAQHSLGIKQTDETKRKLSEINRGEKHPMYGKHHTEEAKRAISKNSAFRTPVDQLDLMGNLIAKFETITEAAMMTNHPDYTKIGLCCRGVRKTTRGFRWRYSDR